MVEEKEEDSVDRAMDLHAKMTWQWGQTLVQLSPMTMLKQASPCL